MTLENEVKQLLIETLNLEDHTVDDIQNEAQLFDGGLGLDSIDALELGVAIKKKYNVSLDADGAGAEQHFQSINTLVSFIQDNQ